MRQVSPDGPGWFALQIFMLFLVHAYSTRVWKEQEADNSKLNAATIEHGFQSPEGHRKLVMDGPWTLLWPCVLLWPFLQVAIALGWMHNVLSISNCAAAIASAVKAVHQFTLSSLWYCTVTHHRLMSPDLDLAS